VVESSEADFALNVADHFHLGNLIDYILYVNATTLVDNTGKNAYLARYRNGAPYFYVPWDLDASFGNQHDGERYDNPDTWLTNGLHDRLWHLDPDNYRERFCNRYKELRRGLLDPTALNDRIQAAVDLLANNGVYRREAVTWPASVDYSDDYREYVNNWNEYRGNLMDSRVCGKPISIHEHASRLNHFRVYPNPAGDYLLVDGYTGSDQKYALYDVAGHLWISGNLQASQTRVELPRLAAGVYILRVGRLAKRVVIRP
jgi:hypothetical protein